MAEGTVIEAKTPFGVGGVIGSTFSVFFSRFGVFFILGVIPALVVLGVNFMLIGDLALGQQDPAAMEAMFSTPAGISIFLFASMLLPIIGFAVSTAMIVRAAYDAKLGRPVNLGSYVGEAVANIIPIAVLTFAITLLASIAMLALIVPGLYVYAMFTVMVPAIVIERAGFGGASRSVALTKGYRWPVLGAFLIIVVIMIALSMAVSLGVTPILLQGGTVIVAVVVSALMQGAIGALTAVFYSMVYARLREIKEGAGVDQLAEVFS